MWLSVSNREGEVCMFRLGPSILRAGEAWMSVSLITGIGEKVSPRRLTTPMWDCVCAGANLCVCVWVPLWDSYLRYDKVCVSQWVCVAVKQRVWTMPRAEIDSLAKRRKWGEKEKWQKVMRSEKSRKTGKEGKEMGKEKKRRHGDEKKRITRALWNDERVLRKPKKWQKKEGEMAKQMQLVYLERKKTKVKVKQFKK